MKTPKVTIENLKKAYIESCSDVKKVLENLYGKEVFESGEIKTFEDACKALGIDNYKELPDDEKSVNAYRKLIIIIRALNEGWQPDWENSNEYKYYPWFKMKSGFGFSVTYFVYSRTVTYAGVGSRLCFKTSELAEYAGKQFENIYKDYLTL